MGLFEISIVTVLICK